MADGDQDPTQPTDSYGWFAYAPLKRADLPADYDPVAEGQKEETRMRALYQSRNDDGTLREFRLMSDYSAEPVWAEGGNISIGWLGLDPELERDILAWDQLFQRNFHWDGGWRDPSARAEYARLGPVLHERLAAAIAEFGVVELRMWPVETPSAEDQARVAGMLDELMQPFDPPQDDSEHAGDPSAATIWLDPDFGIDWPLWREGPDGYRVPTSPAEIGISSLLSDRIQSWHQSWLLNYDAEQGWISPFAHRMSWGEQRMLRSAIRAELGPDADVRSS